MTDKKIDYVAWGLDEATPGIIDESMKKREDIFKKLTRRLDRLTFIVLLSTIAQLALIYQIYTNI